MKNSRRRETLPLQTTDPDLIVVRRRWAESLLPASDADRRAQVQSALTHTRTLRPDGTWPDVRYADKTWSSWGPSTHTSRIRLLALAYACLPENAGERPLLAETAVRALGWWAANDPICPNWWWNEIGIGQMLSETLLCLGEAVVPADSWRYVTGKVLPRSDKKATGANQVWFCENLIALGILANRPDVASRAFGGLFGEIKSVPQGAPGAGGEGIQPDRSLHQHGAQFYSGGYGLAFAGDTVRFASFGVGTRFQIAPERMTLLTSYLLDGEQWMIRGDTFDYSAVGREITRRGKSAVSRSPSGAVTGFARAVTLLAERPVPRRDELVAFAARLAAGYTPRPKNEVRGSRHFWCSDYMAHRREEFLASVRMYSTRTQNTEMVNLEGRRSHHLADGAMYLYRTGAEYRDIFPLWDWRKIPGTTAEQGAPDLSDMGKIARHGTTDFVGGVTDGDFGLAAFDFARDTLCARKAWAFFDDCIVCLGAGIVSDSDRPVITTVEQRWAAKPGSAIERGDLPGGMGSWLRCDGVGYLFPAGYPKASAAVETRTGRWSDFGAGSSAPVTGDVFSVTLDHGVRPSEGRSGYAYAVFPRADGARFPNNPFSIVANTPKAQAVWRRETRHFLAAFYEPGTIGAGDNGEASWRVDADQSCLVSLRPVGKDSLRVAVSNPRNQPLRVTLSVGHRLTGDGARPNPKDAALTDLVFDLPGGDDAGRSVVRDFRMG